jgi:3-deoxy-manno-octulosonate cytidylyltransferase (CMP-KDO synthetase)
VSCIAVIPARFASTRLPGKSLVEVGGLPLIVHVVRRVAQAKRIDRVIVATDDGRISEAVARHGGEAWMTRADHVCGTDRVAEVAATLDARIVINVQGDEPLISPDTIDATVAALDDASVQVATPVTPFVDGADPTNPSRVKAVLSNSGEILYFSRQPIPSGGPWWRHIGVYAFQADALQRFAAWGPSELERSERLEQLRLLAHGVPIRAVPVQRAAISVDTPADLDHLRNALPSPPQQRN